MLAPPQHEARDAKRPRLEFIPLSSGSGGNSTLVRSESSALLVDAGLERSELLDRLDVVRQRASALDGILVTHRHLDHVRAAATIARRHGVRLFATERCLQHQQRETIDAWTRIHPGLPFEAGQFRVEPVLLAHDAPETCAFVLEAHGVRMGIATDLGSSGGALTQVFRGLSVVALEFNYDPDMLRTGPYSAQLKDRVRGDRGHLSNEQATQVLKQIKGPELERVYVAHVSQRNNTRELASAAARAAFSEREASSVEILIAEQDRVSAAWTWES